MAVLAETLTASVATRRRAHSPIGGSTTLSILGFATLAAAWLGAARTARVEDQIPWLAIALIGLALACGAPVWSLTGQRRAVALRISDLTTALEVISGERSRSTPAESELGDELVASPSMVRYHRPACPLATGKRVAAASRAAHDAAGRRACGICEP